jgi:hypothetical protein
MGMNVELEEKNPVVDLQGKALTLQRLRMIVAFIETRGAVTVKNAKPDEGTPVADWLGLVLRDVEDRRTAGIRFAPGNDLRTTGTCVLQEQTALDSRDPDSPHFGGKK